MRREKLGKTSEREKIQKKKNHHHLHHQHHLHQRKTYIHIHIYILYFETLCTRTYLRFNYYGDLYVIWMCLSIILCRIFIKSLVRKGRETQRERNYVRKEIETGKCHRHIVHMLL